jgi:sarcosine oxidase
LTEIGAAFERLNALELQRRFPAWRVPDDWVALHSQDAGILEPSHAVEVMVALARAHGATLLEHTTVEAVDLEQSMVRTNKGVFTASQIVVAAGGWLPELFPQWKSSLEVTNESVMYFAPKNLESFSPERFPLFIEHETLAYGFPVFGLPGVKVGLHHSGSAITPGTTASTRSLEVAPEAIARVQSWFDSRLPGQDWRLIQARTCLYTNTPSHDFLIDAHPDAPNVFIVSPCSGHGFKFSAYLGVVVADRLAGVPNELAGLRFTFEHVAQPGTGALLARAS